MLPTQVMSMFLPSFVTPILSILKGEGEVTPTAVKFAAFLQAVGQDEKTTKLFLRKCWDYFVSAGVEQKTLLNGLENLGALIGVPLEVDTPLEEYLLLTAKKVSENILSQVDLSTMATKGCPVCNTAAETDDGVVYTCSACHPPRHFV